MRSATIIFFLLLLFKLTEAQADNEIQVYASPTIQQKWTIFELHSNFTFSGEKNLIAGVRPTYHSLHETVEITHGITENFELGFYLFTNFKFVDYSIAVLLAI